MSAADRKPADHETEARYLLIKGGLYYRPNRQGYTGVRDDAGRYSEEEGKQLAAAGVTYVHENEAVEFMPSTWPEIKAEHFNRKLIELRTELAALHKAQDWRPVEVLHDLMTPGEQLDVLFGSPEWACPIAGMVTRWEDRLDWCLYDQINDKFIEWKSEIPTLFVIRPNLPMPADNAKELSHV